MGCLWWRIISEDLEGQFVVENNLHDGDEVKLIVIKENDYGKEEIQTTAPIGDRC